VADEAYATNKAIATIASNVAIKADAVDEVNKAN
jgi:hypothetical protein